VFLVDTNVLSELTRRRPNAGVLGWMAAHPTFAISAITLEELVYGVERAPVSRRRALTEWVEEMRGLVSAVVPVDEAIARLGGGIRATRDLAGRPVAQADCLIAATSIVAGAVLVTRNVADFQGCGATILDPFY
jgi:toxin FitB